MTRLCQLDIFGFRSGYLHHAVKFSTPELYPLDTCTMNEARLAYGIEKKKDKKMEKERLVRETQSVSKKLGSYIGDDSHRCPISRWEAIINLGMRGGWERGAREPF